MTITNAEQQQPIQTEREALDSAFFITELAEYRQNLYAWHDEPYVPALARIENGALAQAKMELPLTEKVKAIAGYEAAYKEGDTEATIDEFVVLRALNYAIGFEPESLKDRNRPLHKGFFDVRNETTRVPLVTLAVDALFVLESRGVETPYTLALDDQGKTVVAQELQTPNGGSETYRFSEATAYETQTTDTPNASAHWYGLQAFVLDAFKEELDDYAPLAYTQKEAQAQHINEQFMNQTSNEVEAVDESRHYVYKPPTLLHKHKPAQTTNVFDGNRDPKEEPLLTQGFEHTIGFDGNNIAPVLEIMDSCAHFVPDSKIAHIAQFGVDSNGNVIWNKDEVPYNQRVSLSLVFPEAGSEAMWIVNIVESTNAQNTTQEAKYNPRRQWQVAFDEEGITTLGFEMYKQDGTPIDSAAFNTLNPSEHKDMPILAELLSGDKPIQIFADAIAQQEAAYKRNSHSIDAFFEKPEITITSDKYDPTGAVKLLDEHKKPQTLQKVRVLDGADLQAELDKRIDQAEKNRKLPASGVKPFIMR